MAHKEQINPEIEQHLAAMDAARVEKNAETKSYAIQWSSYKGHARGLIAGIALGILAGSGIGLAVALACHVAIATLVPVCAAVGLGFGARAVGSAGAASGACAADLAEKHARTLDPANDGDRVRIADDRLMADGRGNHYEFPDGRDRGKIFNWKSGLAGALIGVASGVVLGALGEHLLVEIPAIHALAAVPAIAAMGAAAAPVIAGALVMGIIGLSFGIERSLFKSVFNAIADLMGGKERTRDLGREQAIGKSEEQLLEARISRQTDIHHLQADYDEKIFMGGIKGWFRNAISGAVVCTLVGAAAGILAIGLLAAAGVTALPAMAIIAGFAATGTVLGAETFGETGIQSAALSTMSAIDDEFDRNRALRERGIELPLPRAPAKPGFDLGITAVMGCIGAAIGVAIAPLIGASAIGHLLGAHLLAGSALIGGFTGAASGFGEGVVRKVVTASNTLYNNTYYGHEQEIQPERALTPDLPQRQRTSPVTLEEAAQLDQKLTEGKVGKGNLSDIIARQNTRNALSPSTYMR